MDELGETNLLWDLSGHADADHTTHGHKQDAEVVDVQRNCEDLGAIS